MRNGSNLILLPSMIGMGLTLTAWRSYAFSASSQACADDLDEIHTESDDAADAAGQTKEAQERSKGLWMGKVASKDEVAAILHLLQRANLGVADLLDGVQVVISRGDVDGAVGAD